MALFNFNGEQIKRLPRRRQNQFDLWRRRLSDSDYQRALDGIQTRVEGKEFVVSSFLPGKEWTQTEFKPLYQACLRNFQHSGWFFGLIVWQFMIDDPDYEWVFIKPSDEEDVKGMRYFIPR